MLTRLIEAFEHLTMDRQLLKEELKVQGKVLAARVERKSGKRLVLEGIRVASNPEVYQKIKAIEDAAAAKKKQKVPGRGRGRPRKV